MQLRGIHKIKSWESKTTTNGKEFAILELDNGLKVTTWSQTVITEAQVAIAQDVPLAFWGEIRSKEYQGKFYSDLIIDTAQALTVEKLQAAEKSPQDLPF